MYKYVKECVSYCLNKNVGKCVLKLMVARMMKCCFWLYIASVIYLFTINTSLTDKFDIYVKSIVCTAVTFIGLFLFYLSKWYNISWKYYTVSKMQRCEKIYPTVKFITKIITVQFSVTILKTLIVILTLLPSTGLSVIIFFMLQNGVSKMIALICMIGLFSALITGIFTSAIICNRYYLAEYCAITNYNGGVVDSIKSSIYLMDFKCIKLFKYRIHNSYLKIFGSIIPRFKVIAVAREIFYITDKTTEYARKAHTPKKAVVFYFKDITA